MALKLRTNNTRTRLTQLGGDTPPQIQGGNDNYSNVQSNRNDGDVQLQGPTRAGSLAHLQPTYQSGNRLQPANAPTETKPLRRKPGLVRLAPLTAHQAERKERAKKKLAAYKESKKPLNQIKKALNF
jgi:hypothetical protein